jgi:hypothetical protein
MIHCGKPMLAYEYAYDHPCHFDGISEWRCEVCGIRIGRFSGRVLKDEEFEKPYDYPKENEDE